MQKKSPTCGQAGLKRYTSTSQKVNEPASIERQKLRPRSQLLRRAPKPCSTAYRVRRPAGERSARCQCLPTPMCRIFSPIKTRARARRRGGFPSSAGFLLGVLISIWCPCDAFAVLLADALRADAATGRGLEARIADLRFGVDTAQRLMAMARE